MTDLPTYCLRPHKAGDSFRGVTLGPVRNKRSGAIAFASPVASARVTLRGANDAVVAQFSTATGAGIHPISIVDAAQWIVRLEPITDWTQFAVQPGVYAGELETTDSTGFRRSICVLSLTVTKDRTR